MKKTPMSVDIYDFDHTIYSGDCSLDFYFFCLEKQPGLIRFLPHQVWHAFRFKLGVENRTTFKSNFFSYLRGVSDINRVVESFLKSHLDNIKDWYLKADHKNDAIISASPDFLLRPAFENIKAHTLIATVMNPRTGVISGKNCWGKEKVVRFKKEFGDTPVNKAYGDSKADLPVLSLAKEAYIVKGSRISPVEQL